MGKWTEASKKEDPVLHMFVERLWLKISRDVGYTVSMVIHVVYLYSDTWKSSNFISTTDESFLPSFH